MQILPISELKVFDVAVLKTKTVMTTLSISVDGVNNYSMAVQGTPNISSGKNTVGAFRDKNKDSLFAWIDPVSNEFLQTTAFVVFHPILLLPLAIFVSAGMTRKYIGISENFPLIPVFVISALITALLAVKIKQKNNHEVEDQLRLALRTNFPLSSTDQNSREP